MLINAIRGRFTFFFLFIKLPVIIDNCYILKLTVSIGVLPFIQIIRFYLSHKSQSILYFSELSHVCAHVHIHLLFHLNWKQKKKTTKNLLKYREKKLLFLVLVVFHYIQLKSICANFIQQQTKILILLLCCVWRFCWQQFNERKICSVGDKT